MDLRADVELHYQTLSIAIGASIVVSTIIMTLIWRINPSEDGLFFWALASAIGVPGFLVMWFRPYLGPYTTMVNNFITLTSSLLVLEGILRFRGIGKPGVRLRFIFPALLLFLVAAYFNKSNPESRYLVSDLTLICFYCCSAWFLVIRTTGMQRIAHGFTAMVFLLFSAVLAYRWSLAAMGLIGQDFKSHPITGIVFFAILIWVLSLTYGLSLLVNLKVRSEIDKLLRHDTLTGLFNRHVFEEHFESAAARCDRLQQNFGLALLDLNGFKRLNDTHGHVFGDYVLRGFAERMRSSLREIDDVFRTGGDEFIILFQGADSQGELDTTIERLKSRLNGPMPVQGKTVDVSISIGGALYPDDGSNMDALMNCADKRMYQDKEQSSR